MFLGSYWDNTGIDIEEDLDPSKFPIKYALQTVLNSISVFKNLKNISSLILGATFLNDLETFLLSNMCLNYI